MLVDCSSNRKTDTGRFSRWSVWIAGIALIGAVTLAYWNSLSAPFIFDDAGAVENNSTIRQLWSWQVLSPPPDGSTTTGRPLLNVSFAINYAGGQLQVEGYHAVNLALHAFAALALFGLIRRTLESRGFGERERGEHRSHEHLTLVAFSIALLWALHPLQTESVTGIAQRSEVLCGLFYLLTLYAFVRGTHPNSSRGWLGFSMVACLLGMACKEVMVTAPVIVLLYDRTFVAGSFVKAWRARWRYHLALASTWLLLAWLVLQGAGKRGAAAGAGLGISAWDYLLTQCDALITYLKLSFWPHPLVLDYGTGVRSIGEVWWQGLIVLSLLGLTVWALARKPVLGFLGAWFFFILAPSSSVIPLVTQTIAEHRMYLPLVAIVAAVVVVMTRRLGFAAMACWGVIAVLFGGLTIARNRDYADPVTLWADSAKKCPSNPRAHNNLGLELSRREKFNAAYEHFARAVAVDPLYVSAHYNWGAALLEEGRADAAVEKLATAVHLAPTYADAHLALGNALMQQGKAEEAVHHFNAALDIQPAADVHYNLGVALMDLHRDTEAAGHFRAALELRVDLPDAHYQLGRIAENERKFTEAVEHHSEAIRQVAQHVAAHRRLGMLLARTGDFVAAARHFDALIQIDPNDADALVNLGNTFLARGDAAAAITRYERALRLRPDDSRSRANLQLAREALRQR